MGKAQRERYDEITDGKVIMDYVVQEAGKQISAKEVTAALKLFYQLRCCDGLQSLPGQASKDNAKLDKYMELITGELGDQKVITYARYHQPLDEIAYKLDLEGIPWTRIDGEREDEENDAARLAFVNGDVRILLMTDKGSYALNLQAECNYGIAFDTKYNPKKIEQLHGRNRRPKPGHVGEYTDEHKVIWYHLLCKDTSEEPQWILLREREQEFADMFGLADELFTHLTPSEQEAVVAGQLPGLAARI